MDRPTDRPVLRPSRIEGDLARTTPDADRRPPPWSARPGSPARGSVAHGSAATRSAARWSSARRLLAGWSLAGSSLAGLSLAGSSLAGLSLALCTLTVGALGCENADDPALSVWAADRNPVPLSTITSDLPVAATACAPSVSRLHWQYSYDAGDRRVRSTLFEGTSTLPVRVETSTFDDTGRVVAARAEWNAGQDFVLVTLERDPDGRVVRRTVDASDSAARASAEVIERGDEHLVVHATGAVLLLRPYEPMTAPTIDASAFDAIHDPLVRGDALVLGLLRHLGEGGAAAPLFDPFEVMEVRTLDDAGRVVAYDWDLTADGEADMTESVTYALVDGGQQVTRATDWKADGAADRVVVERFDGAGRLVAESRDDDGDGAVETARTLTYDLAGALVGEQMVDGAGRLQIVTRYERSPGQLITEVDADGDGAVDHRTALYVRDDGQRVLKLEDEGDDGLVDWQKRYVYDEAGRRVYDERDHDVDGRADQRWDYGWDASGRLLHEVQTQPASAACAGLRTAAGR